MKKTFTLLALCAAFIITYGQESDTLKATAGKFTTELNVNLFQGNLSFNNALQQIKVRYFLQDNVALRFGFDVNSHKLNNQNVNPYGNNPVNQKDDGTTSSFSFNAGVEKHFKGTKRLSPYIGAEFSITTKSTSEKITNGTAETDIDGAWQGTGVTYNNNGYPTTYTNYTENGYFKYGVNLVCGFDYYFAKNFYAGYEFLFQYSKTNYSDISITDKGTGNVNTSPNPTIKSNESFLGSNLINGIRLGFIF